MPAHKVAAIRLKNNNITVSRVFLDETDDDSAQRSTNDDIPNPVETFAQCFQEYPDLMGKHFENVVQKLQTNLFVRFFFKKIFRTNPKPRIRKTLSDPITSMASSVER